MACKIRDEYRAELSSYCYVGQGPENDEAFMARMGRIPRSRLKEIFEIINPDIQQAFHEALLFGGTFYKDPCMGTFMKLEEKQYWLERKKSRIEAEKRVESAKDVLFPYHEMAWHFENGISAIIISFLIAPLYDLLEGVLRPEQLSVRVIPSKQPGKRNRPRVEGSRRREQELRKLAKTQRKKVFSFRLFILLGLVEFKSYIF